jgi:hypothetical protein
VSVDYKYAYLIGDLILFLIWILFFVGRKDLRKEIIFVSLLGGFAGLLSEIFYLEDYWRPQLFNGWIIGFEDFLFGATASGISATIYEGTFGKRLSKISRFPTVWFLKPVPLLILVVTVLGISVFGLGISSMQISFTLFLIAFIIIVTLRRDLITNGILSGILMGMMMVICYSILLTLFPELINRFWFVENLCGIYIGLIPIEELVWAFSLGLAAGPYWEFIKGYKLR